MSLVQEVNNKRGFDIDLNVALSEEEENETVVVDKEDEEEEEEKTSVIADSDEAGNRSWETLLDVVELKLGEYEEEETRKKRAQKKKKEKKKKNECHYYDEDCVVARSSRGRAVALPNKFRDSVLEPVADFPRVTRTGKRKSRLSSSWNY